MVPRQPICPPRELAASTVVCRLTLSLVASQGRRSNNTSMSQEQLLRELILTRPSTLATSRQFCFAKRDLSWHSCPRSQA
jgi:hypothetical protein